MSRRTATRRRNLDEDQTQQAMKVLEKFIKSKYRNSVLVSQVDLTEEDPIQRPQSLAFGSRQSTVFSLFPDARGAVSPGMVSVDFSEPTIKEEIKFDSRKESLWHYTSRLLRFFYNYFALKHIIAICILIIYALIGGWIFMYTERPEQLRSADDLMEASYLRRSNYSTLILKEFIESECFNKLVNSSRAALQLTDENSLCHNKIHHILKLYDEQFSMDHGISEGWEWDYWNAVFYAGTVFTTIGYGNLACKTTWGRTATIVYAIIGIPMTLFIMNMLGTAVFVVLKARWFKIKRAIRNVISMISKKSSKSEIVKDNTVESVKSFELSEMEENEKGGSDDSDDDLQQNVPMTVAIVGTFVFIILCSFLFSFWEEWDIFTSFYFTFISMSTIGFGDVIPEHPKYACVLFIFYFIGLWLVSFLIAIMQAQVENRYMWALQLIDQNREDIDEYTVNPQIDDFALPKMQTDRGWKVPFNMHRSAQSVDHLEDSIRWRGSTVEPLASPHSVIIENPGDRPTVAPPVLNVYLQRQMSKRNSLSRSQSVMSRGSHKFRPFSNSPQMSEVMTPLESRTRAIHGGDGNSGVFAGRNSGAYTPGSMSSLGPQRNLTATVPLSVISEVSDEDTIHARKSSLKPVRDLRNFFSRMSKSSGRSDTDADISALCTPEIEEAPEEFGDLGDPIEPIDGEPTEETVRPNSEEPKTSPKLLRPDSLNFPK